MRIRNKKIRDIASIIFTLYYLIAAEQADEKVRKVRAVLTIDHLRVSWNKSTTPYLSFLTGLLRPKFTKYGPRRITIARPKHSTYTEPVQGWMYFNGTLPELSQQKNLVLDIPGGGFVAMSPRVSDDKLLCWAGKTGLPILSLDYKKAPEHPFPYALNECFDVYKQIVMTRGQCVGLKTGAMPRIVLTGDSAGGNLATGTALMIIEHNNQLASGAARGGMIPSPAGLVLLYPALDMNIGSWMTEDQMALIRKPGTKETAGNEVDPGMEGFIRRKSEDIERRYTPTTPRPTEEDDEYEKDSKHDFFAPRKGQSRQNGANTQLDVDVEAQRQQIATSKPQQLKTRLAVSSIISYYGDRILSPEMMRAMVILYVGPFSRPDFKTDYLLCPAVAPESLLVKFPKTYFLTGERDPLVDDTVFFAGRLRQAKMRVFRERQELGLERGSKEFNEREHVEVTLIPGISHGFVQFVSIFPEGWKHIDRCAGWIQDIFARGPHIFEGPALEHRLKAGRGSISVNSMQLGASGSELEMPRHHQEGDAVSSGGDYSEGDDDAPLAMTSVNGSADKRGRKQADRGRTKNLGNPRAENVKRRRSKSISSLGSEEDLLKRRMQGLTISLMGSDA